MKTTNPLSGKTIKNYPESSLRQIAEVLRRGDDAFLSWRQVSFAQRGQRMKKAARILRKNKSVYARLMAEEMGKPFLQGQGEIEKCAWVCDFYADEAEKYLSPEPVKTDATKSFIAFEPLGIVLAIMPWNFPFWQIFRCAAPTLMAGNTMILKHASNVLGCSLAIEKIFSEAGFPKGVFQSLILPNEKVEQLINDPRIKAVTLTGSTRAGKAVGAEAGAVIKKVVLELGGNDPYLILEDADLDAAVKTCVAARLVNGGQSCVAAKRFIVVKSVFEKFKNKFVEQMEAQRMGPPLEEGVTLGPMARHDLRDQLHEQVRESIKQGATLLLGGVIPKEVGAFYPPTVLINVRPGMPAYEEELFGPVAVLLSAADEKEAIRVANDSIFGLGAAVFTKDLKRGERIASKELQAGCCFVNDNVKSDPRLPFGGIKESGYGRELSAFGIREFVNVKTVYIK